MDNKKPRIGVIIFAALYIVVGLGNLITGASTDSRFYVFDNILVRVIGALLVISGIGLLFRKEIARKGIIAALALGIIEVFIGIPTSFNIFELAIGIIILLALYVPGLVYFIVLGNKEYFS